jgi:PAS domain S-box-containing protein
MPFTQPSDRTRELFRCIFEEASLGIAIEDINGTILHANPALCSLLGFSQEELRGMGCSQFAHPEDSQDDWALFQKLRAGEIDRYSLDKRYTRRDGAQIYGHLNVSLVRTGDGGDPLVFAFVEDITARKRAAEALGKSEERFHLAAQAGRMFAYEWDAATDTITRSAECAQILGVEETGRISGAQALSQTHPDDREKVAAAVAALSPEKPYLKIAYRVIRPDNQMLWVERSSRAYFDEQRKLLRIFGMVVDVTERHKADEALRESETKFSAAFHESPMAMTLASAREHRYLDVNQSFERLTGWSRAEVIGHTALDLGTWANPAQRVEMVNRLFDGHAVRNLEVRIRRKDGTEGVALGAADLIEIGDEQCVLSVISDITDRKLAEEARRESEERLRLAVQAGGMYAYEWNPATDEVVRSPEYAGILGPDEPIRTTREKLLQKIHPDDRAKFLAATAGLTPERPTDNVSYRIVSGRKIRWLKSTGRASFDGEGRMLRMIGIVADITDQKAAEEAISDVSRKLVQAQEQERIRIARDLHDDIAQRLALCVVGLEHLQQQAPDAETELCTRIGELRTQLRDIANDVQAISRELHSSKLEYLGIVVASRSLCKEFSERYQVEIRFESYNMPDSMPLQSSLSLFRVLQEALHNAAKHSKGKFFDVKLWQSSEEIHLTVEDRGVGFDVDAAMKGRGLGLTSMRERLRLVNGELSIDSKPNRGTTVHARVPFTYSSRRAAG